MQQIGKRRCRVLYKAAQTPPVCALVERLSGLWPSFGDGLPLHRAQTCPMRLTGGIGINIEQATEEDKIWLVKHKGRSFPEIVVESLLQVMLSCTENCPEQLGTGIIGNGLARDPTIGRTGFTAQPRPAMVGSNAEAGTVMEAIVLSMPYTGRGRLWIDLSYWRCRGRSSLLESARDYPEFGMHPLSLLSVSGALHHERAGLLQASADFRTGNFA